MTVSVHPEASAEFLEAIAYYEERQAGLGLDLAWSTDSLTESYTSWSRRAFGFWP